MACLRTNRLLSFLSVHVRDVMSACMPCMYAVYVRMYVCHVCMPCVIVNKSLYPITDSDIVKGMNRLMRDVMEDSSNRCTLSLPDGERLIVRPVMPLPF